jgi:hypothetical protein
MSKHKSSDYKLTAVNYYLDMDEPLSYNLIKESIKSSIKNIKVINYFNYSKSSLTKTKKDIE